jgi:hypothetical protein
MATIRFMLAVVGIFLAVWLLFIQDYLVAAVRTFVLRKETPQAPIRRTRHSRTPAISNRNRLSVALSLVSFAFTAASWGWAVVLPQSSVWVGSVLFFLAVVSLLAALLRMWPLPKLVSGVIVVLSLCGFAAFDWYIVIRPQRGRDFGEVLVGGYNLLSECSQIPAKEDMPEWMREQSKKWQGRAEELIIDKLNYKDFQVWGGAVIYGRVDDTHMNSYQCLWLANKVSALETVIATNYDPSLKHRDYTGPTYWFNAVNGKVDISDAFKNGQGQANVYINGGSTPMIQVEGKVGKQVK